MYEFQKMHGLGNHFVFFDEMKQDFSKLKKPQIIKALCDIHYGIGSDGIIFIMDPKNGKNQCRMQMFNVDGTEAEMCGNAIRGVAHLFRKHHTGIDPIRIETKAGLREVSYQEEKQGNCYFKVDMGPVSFDLVETGDLLSGKDRKPLVWQDEKLDPVYAHVGNPHCVVFRSQPMEQDTVISMGAWLETHLNHPRRINVEFVEILSKNAIRVNVWERGCGITSACGTGATASAAASVKMKKTAWPVTVHMPGGDLVISKGESENLFMTGPVQEIAEGQLSPSFVDWLFSLK